MMLLSLKHWDRLDNDFGKFIKACVYWKGIASRNIWLQLLIRKIEVMDSRTNSSMKDVKTIISFLPERAYFQQRELIYLVYYYTWYGTNVHGPLKLSFEAPLSWHPICNDSLDINTSISDTIQNSKTDTRLLRRQKAKRPFSAIDHLH